MIGPTTLHRHTHMVLDEHPVAKIARTRLHDDNATLVFSRRTGRFFIARWLNKRAGVVRELPAAADTPWGFSAHDWRRLNEIDTRRRWDALRQGAHDDAHERRRLINQREDIRRMRKDRQAHARRKMWKRGQQWKREYEILY